MSASRSLKDLISTLCTCTATITGSIFTAGHGRADMGRVWLLAALLLLQKHVALGHAAAIWSWHAVFSD